MILASIVEKETGLADERPRDRRGVRQPPAAGHAAGERSDDHLRRRRSGRPLGRGLRDVASWHAATPYNTYLIAGLPPTPIANPGRASLAAVLDPPQTDELYFVADGTGGHVFAADLRSSTSKNVAHWRAIERRAAKPAAGGKLGGDDALSGMTGFARAEGAHGRLELGGGGALGQRPQP